MKNNGGWSIIIIISIKCILSYNTPWLGLLLSVFLLSPGGLFDSWRGSFKLGRPYQGVNLSHLVSRHSCKLVEKLISGLGGG